MNPAKIQRIALLGWMREFTADIAVAEVALYSQTPATHERMRTYVSDNNAKTPIAVSSGQPMCLPRVTKASNRPTAT